MRRIVGAKRTAAPSPVPSEQVWFTQSAVTGMEMLSVRSSARVWSAWHERYTLAVVYAVRDGTHAGGARWWYRGALHETASQQVMLMAPGEWHFTREIHGYGDFDVFELAPPLVERIAHDYGLAEVPRLTTATTRDPALFLAASALARAESAREEPLLLQQRLLAVCARLFEHHVERGSSGQGQQASRLHLARAREYIVEHHADDFDLETLANVAGASMSAISHGLVEQDGASPMALRRLVRVERARSLLAAGMPASMVATTVGFCDQAKLTNNFKMICGVTPGAYARAAARRTLSDR